MTDHMTPNEIAEALERHTNDYDDNEPCCRRCDGRWPCDADRALKALVEMRKALDDIYERYENGTPCYVDADIEGEDLGPAFRLPEDKEAAIIAILEGGRVEYGDRLS